LKILNDELIDGESLKMKTQCDEPLAHKVEEFDSLGLLGIKMSEQIAVLLDQSIGDTNIT